MRKDGHLGNTWNRCTIEQGNGDWGPSRLKGRGGLDSSLWFVQLVPPYSIWRVIGLWMLYSMAPGLVLRKH